MNVNCNPDSATCTVINNGRIRQPGDLGPSNTGMVGGCQSAGIAPMADPDVGIYEPGCASGWPPDGYYYTNMRSKEFFEWVDGQKLSNTEYTNWRWCNNDPDGEVVSF